MHHDAKENQKKDAWKGNNPIVENENKKKRSMDNDHKNKQDAKNSIGMINNNLNECSEAAQNMSVDEKEMKNALMQALEMVKLN